nr:MAG: hypothetical protein [Caudoviricetes sp.]
MTTKFDKNMEEFFEVPPFENNLPAIKDSAIPHETLDIDLKADYETARENFHELIEKGKDAVDDILAIARESERPRDFEVAAGLLKNVLDANDQLISLHKKIREITNYKQQSQEKTTINNALFVGSTTELSKLVKELNQKDIKDLN